MDKEYILAEIRRIAAANGGKAPGMIRFDAETGIKQHDWYGRYWIRWGDALREAGFEPNRMNEAIDDELLLQKLVILTRRLGHVPVRGEIMLSSKNDPSFPSTKAYSRLGSKRQQALRVIAFCEANPGNEDVAAIWAPVANGKPHEAVNERNADAPAVGYVYLLKHGSRREYKIGRTFNPMRREGELGIQLPEKLEPVHYIKTDDPAGIESYWHRRFADKRKEGEWFALSADDVRAFKRWKRIY